MMRNKPQLPLRCCAGFLAAFALLFATACNDGGSARLPSFTVTFNANEGTGTAPAPHQVAIGSHITIPGAAGLSKAGFAFAGWNTSADGFGIGFAPGDAFTPIDNTTLFAVWTAVFTVTFNANDGTGAVPATQTVNKGSGITIPGPDGLSRAGFAFDGWNTSADGTGDNFGADATFMPAANTTLFANWVVAFTVAFNVNGGTGTGPGTQVVNIGSGVTIPGGDGLSRDGFAFAGWNTSADGTGDSFYAGKVFTPTSSTTLFAKWLATITFDANWGAGTVPAPIAINAGSGITIPGPEGLSRTGFVFGGWNTSADGTGAGFAEDDTFTPTGNVTLFARWLSIFTVSFSNNQGIGTPPASLQVTEGSGTAIPGGDGLSRTGFAFGGWNTSADGSGDNFTEGDTFTPTAGTTLYARWLSTFTVVFGANGGSGTMPTSRNVIEDTGITLPGPGGLSRTGHVFGGWNTSADGSGTNFNVLATFTPTGNATLYAKWLVEWNAIANDTAHTTAINLTFGAPVSGLTDDDITVAAGTGAVIRGALTGSGTAWSLPVTVTSLGYGNISISINRPGIESRTETVTVFRPAVSWVAAAYGSPYTTAIAFEFDGPVTGLVADNITVTQGTGLVTRGNLTGSGSSWRLAVGVARAGNVTVSVAITGVESRAETVSVYAVSWTASANNTENTTAIDFTFDAPITDLTAGNITIADGTGIATAGTLTGSGTTWRLAVNTARRGNVPVSISRAGIESGPRSVMVHAPTRMVSAGHSHAMAIRNGELWV